MVEIVTTISFHHWDNCPNIKKFGNTNIFYKFGIKPGRLYDDRQ